MAALITLQADGPLGKAGEQVWVNDATDVVAQAYGTAAK